MSRSRVGKTQQRRKEKKLWARAKHVLGSGMEWKQRQTMCVRRVRISQPKPPTPSGRASLLLTFSVFLVRSCVVLLDHIFRTRASPRWSTAFIFGLHSMFSIKEKNLNYLFPLKFLRYFAFLSIESIHSRFFRLLIGEKLLPRRWTWSVQNKTWWHRSEGAFARLIKHSLIMSFRRCRSIV